MRKFSAILTTDDEKCVHDNSWGGGGKNCKIKHVEQQRSYMHIHWISSVFYDRILCIKFCSIPSNYH